MSFKECKLEDFVEILSGYAFKSKEFVSSGIPVIKIKNIVPPNVEFDDVQYVSEELYNEKTRYALKFNDILISLTGSNVNQINSAVGKAGRVRTKNKRLLLNQRVGKVYVKDESKYSNDFLYYYLIQEHVRYDLASSAGGSANQANINPKNIKDLKIKLPSIEEQKAIAKILSDLDDKIEVNNKINKRLEEMAQAIFKQWFVDFEFPNEEGNPYKSSGGEMVESELGMIPNGWEVKELGDICEVKGGKRLPKGSVLLDCTGEYEYLRVTDVTGGYVNMSNIKYIDKETREKISRYIIEYNDLYISIAGTVGLVGSINKKLHGASLTENMARIICDKEIKHYMKLHLNTENIQHMIRSRSVGSTQPKLPLYVIKTIPVLIGEKIIMKSFSELIDSIYFKVEENMNEIDILTKLRDTILPKLMSGEIRVGGTSGVQ